MSEKSAGVVIANIQGKTPYFLIIRQREGHWGFPKGHLDEGEDAKAAAIREVVEEVGITNLEIVPDVFYEDKYKVERAGMKLDKTVTYFLGISKTQNTSLQENEVKDARWLPYEKALVQLTYEGSKKALMTLAPKVSSLKNN